ncbi:MAG: hypothetical protein H6607_04570 [Flavobacteriales bacterium]|nr:hypothetical protein [Flavobacteriales bacterium]
MVSCINDDVDTKKVLVLGHGGGGFTGYFPPNSQSAILQSLLMENADGVEVDIQPTSDAAIVLFHEPNYELSTSGQGAIVENTSQNATTYHFSAMKSENIWTLGALLHFIDSLKLNVWLSLNIQPNYATVGKEKFNELLETGLRNAFEKYSNCSQVILESRDETNLLSCQNLKNDFGVKLYLTQPITDEFLTFADNNGFDGFVTNYLDETEETVLKARQKGFSISLYGLKIRQDFPRAINLNPDFVQTDNVALTLSFLGR